LVEHKLYMINYWMVLYKILIFLYG
jgi:hypothetical protein